MNAWIMLGTEFLAHSVMGALVSAQAVKFYASILQPAQPGSFGTFACPLGLGRSKLQQSTFHFESLTLAVPRLCPWTRGADALKLRDLRALL